MQLWYRALSLLLGLGVFSQACADTPRATGGGMAASAGGSSSTGGASSGIGKGGAAGSSAAVAGNAGAGSQGDAASPVAVASRVCELNVNAKDVWDFDTAPWRQTA